VASDAATLYGIGVAGMAKPEAGVKGSWYGRPQIRPDRLTGKGRRKEGSEGRRPKKKAARLRGRPEFP